MICYNCNDTIISNHHYDSCITVNMNDIKTINFNELKNKSAMTYGLGSCIAFLIVYDNKVVLCHIDPNLFNTIKIFIKKAMESAKYMYIKTPVNYVKQDNGMYKHEDDTKYSFLNDYKHKVIKETYNNCKYDDKFMSTLYVKMDEVTNTISYTDCYGRWVNVL